jgi:hypothetical protein
MTKFLIIKFSPIPCYLVPLSPRYSPRPYRNLINIWGERDDVRGQLCDIMFAKHCYNPNVLEQMYTTRNGRAVVIRSKLKCHNITSFGLFLFTNKLITMSKLHNYFCRYPENKDDLSPSIRQPGI